MVLVGPPFAVVLKHKETAIGRKAEVHPIPEMGHWTEGCYFLAALGVPELEIALLLVSGEKPVVRRKMDCLDVLPIRGHRESLAATFNVPDVERTNIVEFWASMSDQERSVWRKADDLPALADR